MEVPGGPVVEVEVCLAKLEWEELTDPMGKEEILVLVEKVKEMLYNKLK